MTNREFFEKVITLVTDEEIIKHAKDSIEKLDTKNEKRRSTLSKTAEANKPIKASILKFLDGKDMTLASVIASELEISTNKASALCRQLVDEGLLDVTEVKVKSQGLRKAYKLLEREWFC